MATYQIGQGRPTGPGESMGPNGVYLLRTSSSPVNMHGRSIGAGLSIGMLSSLRMEIVLGWQDMVDTSNLNLYYTSGYYQSQVGLAYQLGGKKQRVAT